MEVKRKGVLRFGIELDERETLELEIIANQYELAPERALVNVILAGIISMKQEIKDKE